MPGVTSLTRAGPGCGTGAVDLFRGGPWRVVYISRHRGGPARSGIPAHEHRFRLVAAGVMDMFPHTAHAESTAFLRTGR